VLDWLALVGFVHTMTAMLLVRNFGIIRLSPRGALPGLMLGMLLLTLVRAGAQSAPASTMPAPAPAASTQPKPPPPDPLPDSVPADVNPFADAKNIPTPRRPTGTPTTLNVDQQTENFDGFYVAKLLFNGPDFTWVTDPLVDWVIAPAGADESAAFVYEFQTKARLSLALYKGKELMPEINRENIIQYLAAVRAEDPKNFALLTPFPKDVTDLLNPTRFSGFIGQGFNYAVANPYVYIYHVWILDLNHQYQLMIKLTSPPSLVDRLDAQIRFTLGRGTIRKGLGVDQPKPAAGSGTAKPAPRTDG